MNVLISTVNYNSSSYTVDLITSIIDSEIDSVHLIVVDNASTTDSFNYLLECLCAVSDNMVATFNDERIESVYKARSSVEKEIYLLRLNDNYGFSVANNIAYQFGLSLFDFNYFWLLNNDTVIEKKTLTELVEFSILNRDSAVLSSKVLLMDGTVWFEGGVYNNYFATAKHVSYARFLSSDKSFLSGCSLFIPRNIIDNHGLLDESIFLYGEDLDYSIRLRNSGVQTDVVMSSIVRHVSGASSMPRSYTAYYNNSLNTISVIVREYGFKMYFTIIPYHVLKIVYLLLFKSVPFSSLKGYVLGVYDSCLSSIKKR